MVQLTYLKGNFPRIEELTAWSDLSNWLFYHSADIDLNLFYILEFTPLVLLL